MKKAVFTLFGGATALSLAACAPAETDEPMEAEITQETEAPMTEDAEYSETTEEGEMASEDGAAGAGEPAE